MRREPTVEYEAFAVSTPGIEHITAAELKTLGFDRQKLVDGGVEFGASRRQLYEANLHLRTASRVLVRLARFRALSFAELERRAQRIPWERILGTGQRVQLRVTCRKSRLYHSDAVAERIARDLKTRMQAEVTKSASEDGAETESEPQLIVVRFDHDHCTVSADSSGAHLHQRGYRTAVTEAPMRETLAAALILASGWDGRSALLDPFCGSGTIPIEAAMIAGALTPGRHRRFQFMRWPGYSGNEWTRVLAAAVRNQKRSLAPICGSDRAASAIRASEANAERAGVSGLTSFARSDALDVTPPKPPGYIVTNPPYGVRLGNADESRRLMTLFGRKLRHDFGGWRVAVLTPVTNTRLLGFRLESQFRTTNGGLRVQLLTGVVPDDLAPTDNQD